MPVLAISASEIIMGDRFSDGTVICGIRAKPDGRIAFAYTRRTWRSRRVRFYFPDEPVSVLRVAPRVPSLVTAPSDNGGGLWPVSSLTQ